jgi:hypothetical protein
MTECRNILLVFCAFALSATCMAQLFPRTTPFPPSLFPQKTPGPPPGGWPEEVVEIYQPIVKDSTLLFPAPWLVWRCNSHWEEEYEFYYAMDLRNVRKCWGRREICALEEVMGVYSFVQHGVGQLYATLEPTAEGFLYSEVPLDSAETALPLRTVLLVFDTSQVVRTDTSLIYTYSDTIPKTLIKRFVELRRAP